MTPAQRAYEAYLGQSIDWESVTPLSRELWTRVAEAVLNLDEEAHG